MIIRWRPLGGGASSVSATPATPGVEMTGQDICTQILMEIGVVNAIDPPSPEDSAYTLAHVNRMLDSWNADARKRFTFESVFEPFTLIANQNPHTIGPTGDFVVVQRPQTIDGASILLTTSTPTIRLPLNIRSRNWYADQVDTETTISIPTDLNYEPTYPNGTINLWMVPSVAYDIELMIKGLLGALTLTDRISLPAGYRDAIIYTGAERMVNPMRVSMPDGLPRAARNARAVIIDANTDGPPALATRDSGMGPDDGGGGSIFNWRNRSGY